MDNYIKNFPIEEVVNLAGQIDIRKGEIASKTLVQNSMLSLTIFAFDKAEEISTHTSNGDAMVFCLEGEGVCTVDGKEHILKKGDSLIMPSKKPHSVYAKEQFKMMLLVVFSN